ncbi:MAG: PQQ-binding-like beta-propeller repeat protein, partial [Chloroflexota bacterium]
MKTNTFLLLVIFTAHWLAWGAAPADRASYAYSLSLDGVDLDLVLPLAGLQFVLPEKDALYPGALAASAAPFQEVSLEAVPDELRPARSALMVGDARANLQDFRRDQQALALDGYTAELFGRPVESLSWRVELLTRVDQAEPVTLHEWLVEAGGRLWLLRIAYGADSPWAQVPLDGVHLDSSRVDVPSAAAALASALPPAPADAAPAAPAADDLPFPSWWDGECDVNNFPGSYPLGGSYRGMPACGPRNTQHLVYFGAGNSQYEWQCPELSKRYLYLAFGTPPYSANGNKVVANYPGDDFEKVNNGAPDKGPSAGDVLSYGATDAVGHTSVVSAASIDASGNGAITIIEQNWSVAGTRTHTVSNWTVSSPGMAVIGWLHLKDGSGGGGGAVVDTQAPAVIWAAPVGNDQLYTPPDATGPVTLQALASDDVGVASVRFSYWDAADALTVTLGSDASAPYQFSLDQRLLPYGDTRMIVEALDGSGKVSPAKQIRLRHSYQAACTACGLGDGFWPAYRGDLQHSGRSAERGPGKTGAAPAVLWQYSSGASSTAPAVGRDGTVYVGLGSSLYAFNLFGGLRWSYATNGTLRAPLTAADGTIYAGGSNGKLHAINPDGTRKWAFTTAGAVSGAPALGVDGAVLV